MNPSIPKESYNALMKIGVKNFTASNVRDVIAAKKNCLSKNNGLY